MDNTIKKLADVINDLIESNEKNYNEDKGAYQDVYSDEYSESYCGGYKEGYMDGCHDALVDVLNQMRIENNHTYYK